MAAEQSGDFYKGAYPSYQYSQNTTTTRPPNEEKSNRRLVCFKFSLSPSHILSQYHRRTGNCAKISDTNHSQIIPSDVVCVFFFVELETCSSCEIWSLVFNENKKIQLYKFIFNANLLLYFYSRMFRVHHVAVVYYVQIVKLLKRRCGVVTKLVNQSAMHAASTISCTVSIGRSLWRKIQFKWVKNSLSEFLKSETFERFYLEAFNSFSIDKLFKCFFFECVSWVSS